MLTDLAFESDLRGLFRFRFISGRMPYRVAAEQILQSDGTVFLLTGFYIPEAQIIENDGLSGSWFLVKALQSLGRKIIVPTDNWSYPVLKQVFSPDTLAKIPSEYHDSNQAWAKDLLQIHSPNTVIAIERPGPDSDGIFRNAKGDDISPFCAGMEHFWVPETLKIAIGDGGNELGMGALADKLEDGRPVCPIEADITLLGSASDFAAWCLVASLEILTGKQFLPDYKDLLHFLQTVSQIGVVDGITGKPDLSIDTYPIDIIQKRYRKIQRASHLIRTTNTIIDTVFDDDRKTQTALIVHIDPRYSAEKETVHLDGYLLLDSQLEKLKRGFQGANKPVSWPAVLSDPENPECPWLPVTGRIVDLQEQPNGRRTTQISDFDRWIRRLYTTGTWYLYQTPDLAMGWSNDKGLAELPETYPAINPWQTLIRAVPGASLDNTLPITDLVDIAAKLLDTPYLWGGRSIDGLDCSAMTQRIFFQLGIMLPRNSKTQRRCGRRIPLHAPAPGDLVFALGKTNGLHHVGIALPDGIQHACLTEKRVILESMEAFRRRYRIIAVRRIFA